MDKNIMEVVHGDRFCTESIAINGTDIKQEFDVYDGHATANDGSHAYDLTYPTVEGIVSDKRLTEVVCERLGVSPKDIEPIHSLQLFSTLYVDGRRTDAGEE